MGYKMKGWSGYQSSPVKQKVDPDAPGTPGKPGYEPPVKREDLDEKGKAIFDKHRTKDIEGPKTEGNIKLQPSENPDVALTGGKGESVSEKIADYEDRIEFIKEDIFNTDKTTPQQKTDLNKLKKELAILRRGSKKPPLKKKKY